MSVRLANDPFLEDVPVVDGWKVLEPNVLCDRIGEGAMGKVYLGHHVDLDVPVAVKCLKLEHEDQRLLARFRREARAAALLDHPRLIRVYGADCRHGLCYITMAYVDGETAFDRVGRKGPLELAEALTIIYEASKGIAAAHRRGITHRDIKPSSIFVSAHGQVKVADLGLAKLGEVTAELTRGSVMGSPAFMPPEQWKAAHEVGPAADVYGLGATLYYLLAGEEPYRAESYAALVAAVTTQPFPDVRRKTPALPPVISKLIAKCTAGRPEARYADAARLAAALKRLLVKIGGKAALEDPAAGRKKGRRRSGPPPAKVVARVREAIASGSLERRRLPKEAVIAGSVLAAVLLVVLAAFFIFQKGGNAPEGAPGGTAAASDESPLSSISSARDPEPGEAASSPRIRLSRNPCGEAVTPRLDAARERLQSARSLADLRLAVKDLGELSKDCPEHAGVSEMLAKCLRALARALGDDWQFAAALETAERSLEVEDSESGRQLIKDIEDGIRQALSIDIEITAPAPGTLIGSSSLPVRGRARYPGEVEVSPRGVSGKIEIFAGRLEGRLEGLPEGPQKIVFEVKGEKRVAIEKSVDVIVDSKPPALEVLSPEAGEHVGSPVAIKGLAKDSSDVHVRLDGRPVRQVGEEWQGLLFLPPGEHELLITAVDAAGNEAAPLRRRIHVEKPDWGPYAGRLEREGRQSILEGATAESEAAVRRALEWLARHQAPDGSWWSYDGAQAGRLPPLREGKRPRYAGHSAFDVGVTGLALLAFAATGHTHRAGEEERFVRAVAAGVEHLKRRQRDDGRVAGAHEVEQWTYNHAIATLALAEILRLSADPELRKPVEDAARLCLRAQNDDYGWRYGIKPAENDTSVTAWMVSALVAAREAARAGLISIPDEEFRRSFDGAINWFDFATAVNGKCGYFVPGDDGSRLMKGHAKPYPFSKEPSSMTGAAVFSRLLLEVPRSAEVVRDGVELLMRHRPAWQPRKGRQLSTINFYYWYYATHALFQYGGKDWRDWNEALLETLLPRQRDDEGEMDLSGSWDPVGEWGVIGGRVYTTALVALTLEVYYRHERV